MAMIKSLRSRRRDLTLLSDEELLERYNEMAAGVAPLIREFHQRQIAEVAAPGLLIRVERQNVQTGCAHAWVRVCTPELDCHCCMNCDAISLTVDE